MLVEQNQVFTDCISPTSHIGLPSMFRGEGYYRPLIRDKVKLHSVGNPYLPTEC